VIHNNGYVGATEKTYLNRLQIALCIHGPATISIRACQTRLMLMTSGDVSAVSNFLCGGGKRDVKELEQLIDC